MRVNVHNDFKSHLASIEWFCEAIGIKDIANTPNEDILKAFKAFLETNRRDYVWYKDDGGKLSVDWAAVRQITGIDDSFFWTGYWLYYRKPLLDMIAVSYKVQTPIYEVWQILKVRGRAKLSQMNASSNVKEKSGQYVEVLWYWKTYRILENKWNIVFVLNVYWEKFWLPEGYLTTTTETNLDWVLDKMIYEEVKERFADSKKQDTEKLTQAYQKTLREFMDISKELQEHNSGDIEDKILAEVNNIKTLGDDIKKDWRVKAVKYVYWKELSVQTWNLSIKHGGKEYPIGTYTINIWFWTGFNLSIVNNLLDGRSLNHPHILESGGCCLSDWQRVLAWYYKDWDYKSFVLTCLEYLESVNPESTYISLESFTSQHKARFEQSLADEQALRNPQPVVVPTEEKDIAINAVLIEKWYALLTLELARQEYQALGESTAARTARGVPKDKESDYVWICQKIYERAKKKWIDEQYIVDDTSSFPRVYKKASSELSEAEQAIAQSVTQLF